jgi:hypothetical protein
MSTSTFTIDEVTFNLYNTRLIDGSDLIDPPSGTIKHPVAIYKGVFECTDYSLICNIEDKIRTITESQIVYREEEWKRVKPAVFDKHLHLVVQSTHPWSIFGHNAGEYSDLSGRYVERLCFYLDAESMSNGTLYARPRRLDLKPAGFTPLTQFQIEMLDSGESVQVSDDDW